MNIVCLSGEVAHGDPEVAVSTPTGWASVVLHVHRDGADGPGVVPVVLVLPPDVVSPEGLHSLWPGRPVLAIGRLEVDVDHAPEAPVAYHSVVVQRIEVMPGGGGPFTSPSHLKLR